jgi:hypothetical protein
MFGQKLHGPTGKQKVNRRQFLYSFTSLAGIGGLLAFFGPTRFAVRLNFYQKALLRRDYTAGPVVVYKMVPLPDQEYSKADPKHMANKIFPTVEAARARRQHKAFFYGLKPVPLPRTLINGMDKYTLFCNRSDFDYRVAKDRRHWQKLGIKLDSVFNVVRSA